MAIDIVDGLRFARCSGTTSAERWRVESASSVLSVSEEQDEKSVDAQEYLRASRGE